MKKIVLDKEKLYDIIYTTESLDTACKIFNCSKSVVQQNMRDYKLPSITIIKNEKNKQFLNEYLNTDIPIKELCSKYNRADKTLYKLLKLNGIEKRETEGRKICNKIENNKELYFYLLGLVASDGYLDENKPRVEISLSLKDLELLQKLSVLIYNKDRIYIQKEFSVNGRCRLFVYGKEYLNSLMKFGLTQKKSETLNMNLELIPQEYFQDFLRGFIDGDGNYRYKNINNIRIRSDGNKDTMYKIQHYIDKYYGLSSNVYKIKSTTNYDFYRWTIQKTYVSKQLIQILYKDAEIYLKRKYDIIANIL